MATPAPRVWRVIATWFGAGLSPRAPGTVGSAASLVLWAPLVILGAPWWSMLALSAVLFALGTRAAQAVVDEGGKEDPQIVVVDEVVGMGVTLTFAPAAWWSLALGFAAFRLFDIAKPWPVSWADRRIKGGFGVMLDDVVAALYALGVVTLMTHVVIPRWWPTLLDGVVGRGP